MGCRACARTAVLFIFLTNQTANKQRKQKKPVKFSLNFTYLHKTQPGQNTAGNLSDFEEILVFGYPGLDSGLNISWFPEVLASPKATRL